MSDLLERYRKKRDFTRTAEPTGEEKAELEDLFVVQKHDASRLHYDFRLALDGVLKSWAVPRGPSLDPGAKRLAVRTEDHPLAYGGFEGTIPKGQYGGGTVMVWDLGRWEKVGDPRAGLKAGRLKFRLHGQRLKGLWALVRMRPRDGEAGENWVLVKDDDAEADRTRDLLAEETASVLTGRSLEAIAANRPPAGRAAKAAAAKAPALGDGAAVAEAAGVKLTSPDRIVFPGQGLTKAEIVAYYGAVHERMLAYVADRPLSLVRCPQGRAKHCFFQKHDSGGFPRQIKRMQIEEKDGETKSYFYVDSLAGLVAGVQMNVLEWHLWGARRDRIEAPERLIFDIDPDEGLDFSAVRDAARDIRALLGELDLESFAMVTGGKGVHVIVPLRRQAEWPEVKVFARTFARLLAAREPDRFTDALSKAKRKGKLFVDYLRNERGATAIAPFSTRSREGAPVAVPVSWEELASLPAADVFSIAEAAERAAAPDPWKGYAQARRSIARAAKAVAE